MKKLFFFLVVIQCVISFPVFSQGGGGVKNGDTAPAFTGKDQDGKKPICGATPRRSSMNLICCGEQATNLRQDLGLVAQC